MQGAVLVITDEIKPHSSNTRRAAEVTRINTYLLYLNNNNVGYRQKHNFK
jgi:hypothetical protein